ncbi:MAG: SDR family oxidoreductase [Pseudomonadales bacterium]|nr:SDR family oxidoreductase [Pseudomonadales bacterium]
MSAGQISLENHTVLVFGGTAGIGLACVKAFAAAGAQQFMLVGRNQERGEGAIAELSSHWPAVTFEFVSADASSVAGAEKAVAACIGTFEKIDILLSTAGGDPMPAIFHTIPIDEIEGMVRGAQMAAMLPARAVLPHMMERGSGVILTMASDAGKVATPGEVAIGASMAGVIMFSKALANEVKRSKIRVNCLTPSIVRGTPLYDVLMADSFASKLFGKAEQLACLGVVEPEDLGQVAAFLASPAASKITGQVVSVNGGISMG